MKLYINQALIRINIKELNYAMNILFLTLLDFDSLDERNIYTDFLRECIRDEHRVFVISPMERKRREETTLIVKSTYQILKLKVGNIQKTNLVEKGISMITLEKKYLGGIKKYFSKIKFDLIIYTTPPITFQRVIEYVRERDQANTYLILRDIFPQNAVDMGMIRKNGMLYRYFRKKEKKLYGISDYIGCLSKANVQFIKSHNPEICDKKLEVYPNSIDVQPLADKLRNEDKDRIKDKYGIPHDKLIFVYGGNLGKPQGIHFIISCLEANKNNKQVFFLIIGSGTEYIKLEKYMLNHNPSNVTMMKALPKAEYEELITVCDVGLVFLDYRFLIPNFPSRILSYMQAGIPVLASTDSQTDIGQAVKEGKFGQWCPSNDVEEFCEQLKCFYDSQKRTEMGKNAFDYLQKYYSIKINYRIVMSHFTTKMET